MIQLILTLLIHHRWYLQSILLRLPFSPKTMILIITTMAAISSVSSKTHKPTAAFQRKYQDLLNKESFLLINERNRQFIILYLFQIVFEIIDCSNLGRNSHSFLVLSSYTAIIIQWIKSILKIPGILEIAADHHSCSSFARFAMNSCNVFGVLIEPTINVSAELYYQRKGRRLMVFETVLTHSTIEYAGIVFLLQTEIVDLIIIAMSLTKELGNIFEIIPIHAFHFLSWITHGYDLVSNINEIQIITIDSTSPLFLAH